ESQGHHHREPWFRCACCPPNISRLLASLGQYVYSVNDTEIAVHLYMQSTSTLPVGTQQVKLRQETAYPWDGSIRLSIETEQPVQFGLKLRIPGWCHEAHLAVNGEEIPIDQNLHKGYVRIERRWRTGDSIVLDLAMPVQRIRAHPDIRDDAGCVALQRGPLLYCLEAADNAVPLHRLRLPATAELESHFDAELLGGVAVVRGNAAVLETGDWSEDLYRAAPARRRPLTFVAIPYYAWDNRQPGEMRLWIHEDNG
ncbi:MAG: glycoside hydrolase family 127 protein, partial [Ktedonobacteraceae bacterium]|nr:glycoside hydrolase family 127 protein [Ktedonobacteraceae bacterium]